MSLTNSLSSKAYQHIQRKLLAGIWTAGDMISEHSVAQELGISRTPVREAIRHLEQEGLLEQVPRYGTRVKALKRQDLAELYEIREALEPYAVERVAVRGLSQDVIIGLKHLCSEIENVAEEMRREKRQTPDAAMMKQLMSADLAFHHLLIREARNGRLMKIVAEGRVLERIFGTSRQEHRLEVIEQTYQHHQRIVDAVEARDGAEARRWMAEHIRASMYAALNHFDRLQAETQHQALIARLPLPFIDEVKRVEDKITNPSSKRSTSRKSHA